MQRSSAQVNGHTLEDINGKLFLNGKPIVEGAVQSSATLCQGLAAATIDELVDELQRRGAEVTLSFK